MSERDERIIGALVGRGYGKTIVEGEDGQVHVFDWDSLPNPSVRERVLAQRHHTTGFLPLTEIPQEIRDEAEKIYAFLRTAPPGRMHVAYETKAEVEEYAFLLRSYCAQRPSGPIRFRRSPTRGLADNVMQFRISDLLPEK